MILFFNDSDPLFVDSNSNEDFFPTVYSILEFPRMLPLQLRLKPGVEYFLKKGANLMWPGVFWIN